MSTMHTSFRWSSLDEIRQELSDAIFRNDLRKRILNVLSEFNGKSVSIRISNKMKEVFPDKQIYISENGISTEKELVFSHWNEVTRNRDDIRICLVKRPYGSTEWGKVDYSWIVSNSGIARNDEWILKISERLSNGHFERYFAKIAQFNALYNEIKEMEV